MATWNTRGLRGSTLEDMVNRTNEKYAEAGLALIQKIPTPITPVKMDKESRQITLAFFEQKYLLPGSIVCMNFWYSSTVQKSRLLLSELPIRLTFLQGFVCKS